MESSRLCFVVPDSDVLRWFGFEGVPVTPAVGDHVACYEIHGVSWDGRHHGVPVWGIVTEVWGSGDFRFLPDLPDLTRNGSGSDARAYSGRYGRPPKPPKGWFVYTSERWLGEYVIQELELVWELV